MANLRTSAPSGAVGIRLQAKPLLGFGRKLLNDRQETTGSLAEFGRALRLRATAPPAKRSERVPPLDRIPPRDSDEVCYCQ